MRTIRRCLPFLLQGLSLLAGCSATDGNEEMILKPVITFDAPEDSYTVKIGRGIWLEPAVTNNAGAAYRWLLEGKVVGTDIIYLFSSDVAGRYFVTFEVSNSVYTVDKELCIDVVAELPPSISMAVPEEGFIIPVGREKTFSPVVGNAGSFRWTVNDQPAATSREYTFVSDKTGEFSVTLRASNEDGSSYLSFNVSVRQPEDIPYSWVWEQDEYNMTLGRTILLAPVWITDDPGAHYTWEVDAKEVHQAESPGFTFTPEEAGRYSLSVFMDDGHRTATKQFTVNVFDNERLNFREITSESSVQADKVWEYLPAPGQFINEYYTATTMDQACAYARERLAQQAYVSLGAFGGYIVVGFDHSVVNDGTYNIQVLGNSFDGSSEPGIVWVMQDENGDGEPNDTWYELRGSEFGKPETIQNYAVTYYRPDGPREDISWVDNLGNEGTVDHLAAYHSQDHYYPNWVRTGTYILAGTRLQDRTVDRSGNGSYWYNGSYDWGYADNFSSIDRLTDDENHEAGINANHFRISDAVDRNGNAVHLEYIDFIKVQTGVQAKAGWLGENSTEVYGVRDYNMIKERQ